MDKFFVLKSMNHETLYYMNWFSDAWIDKEVRLLFKKRMLLIVYFTFSTTYL